MRSRASRWLHILNASLNQTYQQIVYTSTLHQPNYHLINPDGNFLFKGNLSWVFYVHNDLALYCIIYALHNSRIQVVY